MKNFLKKGGVMNYTNSGADPIKSGDLIVVGSVAGVAQTDIIPGDTGALVLEGVYAFPKDGAAIGQGVKCYWDSVAEEITATAANHTAVGVAHYPALAADTTVALQLTNGI